MVGPHKDFFRFDVFDKNGRSNEGARRLLLMVSGILLRRRLCKTLKEMVNRKLNDGGIENEKFGWKLDRPFQRFDGTRLLFRMKMARRRHA